jgi:hypothetical protein
MGRVANIFDVPQMSKSPHAAKGCCKLCVKDCDNTITVRENRSVRQSSSDNSMQVRVWYATYKPNLRLGSLVSIWTCHSKLYHTRNTSIACSQDPDLWKVSHSESGTLSSPQTPLFTSLFPERDRNCSIMIYENSDNAQMYTSPLGYQVGEQLDGLMTLRSFIEGGHELAKPKILVMVKSIGNRKTSIYFPLTPACVVLNVYSYTQG